MTQTAASPAEKNAIRPFRVSIPEEVLTDLRNRIVATPAFPRLSQTYESRDLTNTHFR